MFYLDTSFIIAALTRDEVQSDDARDWLETPAAGTLYISNWVKTEVSSALSLKIRTGHMDIANRAIALRQWRLIVEESLFVIAVQADDFDAAAHFAERHTLSLCAGDALHIAIAKSAGCTLVTLDKRMAEAAIELGVPIAKIGAN